jgi:hypothetical protein
MAGMEGDKRPGRHEAAFNAGVSGGAGQQPGNGERDNQRPRQSAENRILGVVSTVQRQEGEPVDPYLISDKLMTYRDNVNARMKGSTFTQKPGESYQKVKHTRELSEEDHALLQTIMRVQDAFDIDAFSSYPKGYRQTLSEEIYDEDMRVHRPDERFTLTGEEKGILRKIKALAGLPDDPQQYTYTYGAIPHIVDAK